MGTYFLSFASIFRFSEWKLKKDTRSDNQSMVEAMYEGLCIKERFERNETTKQMTTKTTFIIHLYLSGTSFPSLSVTVTTLGLDYTMQTPAHQILYFSTFFLFILFLLCTCPETRKDFGKGTRLPHTESRQTEYSRSYNFFPSTYPSYFT